MTVAHFRGDDPSAAADLLLNWQPLGGFGGYLTSSDQTATQLHILECDVTAEHSVARLRAQLKSTALPPVSV